MSIKLYSSSRRGTLFAFLSYVFRLPEVLSSARRTEFISPATIAFRPRSLPRRWPRSHFERSSKSCLLSEPTAPSVAGA